MNRWESKAASAWDAWVSVTGGPPPNKNGFFLFLAQAQFETSCGDAWRDVNGVPSCCWGACDLRGMNAAEKAAFAAGTLKIGDFLYPDGTWGSLHKPGTVGTLRGDSDPNTGGFRVFFACFDTDTLGASYMLRAGVRAARNAFSDPECTPFTYAKALYVGCCYFGGIHAGARPCGRRSDPLNDAETKNITDYANAIQRQLPVIEAGLIDWMPPGPYGQVNDTFVEHVATENLGDEVLRAGVSEEDPA